MTDLERYILDEWTDDYRSGRLARREFLRRVAVLSGGAAAGLDVLEHHKDVARRLAKAGYAALAVDLASPGGGTDVSQASAHVTALLGRTPADELVGMLQAGVRYLQGLRPVRPDRQGAVGFCFGGGM